MNAAEIAARILAAKTDGDIMSDIDLAHTAAEIGLVMAELQDLGETRESVWRRLHSRHAALLNKAERQGLAATDGIIGERQVRLLESMRHGVDLYCHELQGMANELSRKFPLFVRKVAAFDDSARFRHGWILTDQGCHWLDEIQAARGIRRFQEAEVTHG